MFAAWTPAMAHSWLIALQNHAPISLSLEQRDATERCCYFPFIWVKTRLGPPARQLALCFLCNDFKPGQTCTVEEFSQRFRRFASAVEPVVGLSFDDKCSVDAVVDLLQSVFGIGMARVASGERITEAEQAMEEAKRDEARALLDEGLIDPHMTFQLLADRLGRRCNSVYRRETDAGSDWYNPTEEQENLLALCLSLCVTGTLSPFSFSGTIKMGTRGYSRSPECLAMCARISYYRNLLASGSSMATAATSAAPNPSPVTTSPALMPDGNAGVLNVLSLPSNLVVAKLPLLPQLAPPPPPVTAPPSVAPPAPVDGLLIAPSYPPPSADYMRRMVAPSQPEDGSRPRVKRFICTWEGCTEAYRQSLRLTEHMRKHTGERPFKCMVNGCQKTFAKFDNLKAHHIIHTGERPHKCTIEGCGADFYDKGALKNHVRAHYNIRPFKCPYPGCEALFGRNSHLTVHKRNHTGERPYVCTHEGCEKAFARVGDCARHMTTVHGVVKPHVGKVKTAPKAPPPLSLMPLPAGSDGLAMMNEEVVGSGDATVTDVTEAGTGEPSSPSLVSGGSLASAPSMLPLLEATAMSAPATTTTTTMTQA